MAATIKDVVVAGVFGIGSTVDAFLIAFLLPTFIATIVGNSFNAALVPTYIEVREQAGQDAAHRLFSGTVLLSTLLLIIVTLVLAFLAPYLLPLLAPGFSHENLELTERLFYMLLPIVPMSGLAMNWSSILNAGEQFGVAAFTPIAVPLATVLVLLASSPTLGVSALAVGSLLGFLLQLLLLGWALRRKGIDLWPRWCGLTVELRRVMNQYLPVVAGAMLMNSTIVVDQAVASTAGPGGIAALGYGNKLALFMSGISTMALGTAILPYLSEMTATSDWAKVRHTLALYAKLVLIVATPVTIMLVVLSEPIVRILFEHGAFTSKDTSLVAEVQSLYLLQIPFTNVSILLVRFISSLKANHIIMWGTAISCVVNAVLDYILLQLMGIPGIALSTSIVYLINFCFLFVMVLRRLKGK
jgi:putative peptidoglycan lipid II flippase